MKMQTEKAWRALSSKLKQWIHDRPWSNRAEDAHGENAAASSVPPGIYVTTADLADENFGLAAPGGLSVQAEAFEGTGSGGVYGVIYDPKNSPDSLDWAESIAVQDHHAETPAEMITDAGSYLAVHDTLTGADVEPGGWGHVIQHGSTEGGFELPVAPPAGAQVHQSDVVTGHAEGQLNISDVFNDRKTI